MKMTRDVHWLDQQIGLRFAAKQLAAEMVGGFTVSQMLLLNVAVDLPGANQQQLCSATGIDRSTLADMVPRLIAGGHMTRKRDSRVDARMYQVHVTASGEKLFMEQRGMLAKVEKTLVTEAKAMVLTW